jgi:hypothetical protein
MAVLSGQRVSELDTRPHGTRSAARRHYRHGEQPCEPCRQAEARYWRDVASPRRAARRRQAREVRADA